MGRAAGADSTPAARRHIVLVGLPGAGKTTVGRALARRLGRPFVDFDAEIERREGRTIPAIFETDGEEHFRRLEARLSGELLARDPAVLSPGGGWVGQPGLIEAARAVAVLVHLRVSPATALRRMGTEAAARPLLTGTDRLGAIEGLWHARRERYALADVDVDTEVLDAEEVAERVLGLIGRSGT